MIGRLNHLAIVVPDLAAAAARYRDLLGASVDVPRELPDHGVTVVFVELPNSKIELMTPLGANSPVAKFLADHPGGGINRLDRPPMNALNRQVQDELVAAAEEASQDDSVKAVVVYGGPKVLAAGADIKEMNDMTFA